MRRWTVENGKWKISSSHRGEEADIYPSEDCIVLISNAVQYIVPKPLNQRVSARGPQAFGVQLSTFQQQSETNLLLLLSCPFLNYGIVCLARLLPHYPLCDLQSLLPGNHCTNKVSQSDRSGDSKACIPLQVWLRCSDLQNLCTLDSHSRNESLRVGTFCLLAGCGLWKEREVKQRMQNASI